MTTPFFSIIVPVYCVENYLVRCIDSILSQSFDNFELILVDDGSTDNSPAICDSYSEKDSRIRVFHKKNGGASDARNYGLNVASGIYVLFVDSDDYWNCTDGLEALAVHILNNNDDLVFYGYKTIDFETESELTNSKLLCPIDKFNLLNKKDKIQILQKSKVLCAAAWAYTVKRSLVEELNLRFPVGLTAEDFFWSTNLYYFANDIGIIDKSFYSYVHNRVGSVTSTQKTSGIKGVIYAIDSWLEKDDSCCLTGVVDFLCRSYIVCIYSYAQMSRMQKIEIYELLNSRREILMISNKLFYKSFYFLLRFLGIDFISAVVLFVKKHFVL